MQAEFEELIQAGEPFLIENGFKLVIDINHKKVFKNELGIYIALVDQLIDGVEIWIGELPDKEFIQFGFILEYYLTNQIELTKKSRYLRNSNQKKGVFEYHKEFYKMYYKKIVNEPNFSKKFVAWMNENIEIIKTLSKELLKV